MRKKSHNFGTIMNDIKNYYDSKIEALEEDNGLLKKTLLDQQNCLEGTRREKVKERVFVSGFGVRGSGVRVFRRYKKRKSKRTLYLLGAGGWGLGARG